MNQPLTSFKMPWLHGRLYSFLALSSLCNAVIFKPQNVFQTISGNNASFPIDIKPLFNNRAFGMQPNEADFDGSGSKSAGDGHVSG